MKKPRKTLPSKPSALIRLAIKDLIKTEVDPKYTVDMGTWHSSERHAKCAVCLAGAVMAKSLGAVSRGVYVPSSFNYPLSIKLAALDHLRQGYLYYALLEIEGPYLEKFKALPLRKREAITYVDIIPYENSPSIFKKQMLSFAKKLEQYGL